MTNRYPLVIDVTDKKLKELPIGDNLLISGSVKMIGIGAIQLPKITTVERDSLTSEIGNIIYNTDTNTVQVFVAISDWISGNPPTSVPGWVNLYTPPLPPE